LNHGSTALVAADTKYACWLTLATSVPGTEDEPAEPLGPRPGVSSPSPAALSASWMAGNKGTPAGRPVASSITTDACPRSV
jgi:hypothetical protein